jgi:hypothetical protein
MMMYNVKCYILHATPPDEFVMFSMLRRLRIHLRSSVGPNAPQLAEEQHFYGPD